MPGTLEPESGGVKLQLRIPKHDTLEETLRNAGCEEFLNRGTPIRVNGSEAILSQGLDHGDVIEILN